MVPRCTIRKEANQPIVARLQLCGEEAVIAPLQSDDASDEFPMRRPRRPGFNGCQDVLHRSSGSELHQHLLSRRHRRERDVVR